MVNRATDRHGPRPRRHTRWLVLLACLALLTHPPAAVAKKPDSLDKSVRYQERKLLGSYRALVKWTMRKGLSGFQHRIHGLILQLESDDRRAREALGYVHTGQGFWERVSEYTPPDNESDEHLPEAEARLEKARAAYRDGVAAALKRYKKLTPLRRDEVIARVIQLYPGESKLRAARGEVEHEGRWMLPGTVSSRERREEIADDVANLRERLQHDLRVNEKLMKAGWKGAFTCRERTAIGTVEASEVRDAMLHMFIGDYIASDVLETDAPAGKVLGPTTAILVPGTDAARAVARNLGCGKDLIAALERVHSIYVDNGQTALFLSGWKPYRRVGPLSYTLAAHITKRFGHHKQGWLKEGLRQRLIYLVTGQHGRSLAKYRITVTADGLVEGDVPDNPHAWLAAASIVLHEDGVPRLTRALTAPLDEMTRDDVLLAYGMSAYLIEAHHEVATDFMLAATKGTDLAAAVKDHLDTDLASLVPRLRLWLTQQM